MTKQMKSKKQNQTRNNTRNQKLKTRNGKMTQEHKGKAEQTNWQRGEDEDLNERGGLINW